MELRDNGMCFGCGRKNPIGLKLVFHEAGDLFYTTYRPGPEFQGYPGVIHGGIVSTLLDEVMANHLLSKGQPVVTAELTVRFMHPVPVGTTLKICSKIVRPRKHLTELQSWLEDSSGQILAKGQAKMMHVQERGNA